MKTKEICISGRDGAMPYETRELISLAANIVKMKSLLHYLLSNDLVKAVGDESYKQIIKSFKPTEVLTIKNFDVNHKFDIEDFSSGVDAIVKILKVCRELEVIDLQGNGLTDVNIEVIMNALEGSACIGALDFRDNKIEDFGVQAITSFINKNGLIKILNLRDNNFSGDGAAKLAKLLEKNDTIETLDITGNKIDSSSMALVAEGLSNNKTLKSFSFSLNENNVTNSEYMHTLLKSNSSITSLAISGYKDGDQEKLIEFVRNLTLGIDQNNTLLSLSFMDIFLGYNSTEYFFEKLKVSSKLVELNLYKFFCKDLALVAVSNFLENNKSIKYFGCYHMGETKFYESAFMSKSLCFLGVLSESSDKKIELKVKVTPEMKLNSWLIMPVVSEKIILNDSLKKLLARNDSLLEKFKKKLIFDEPSKFITVSKSLITKEAKVEEEQVPAINLSLQSLFYMNKCMLYYIESDMESTGSYDPNILRRQNLPTEVSRLFGEYLKPQFYQENFFKLAGVCKVLQAATPTTNKGIYDLPEEIIHMIVSFIPLDDYKLDLSGNSSSDADNDILIDHIG